ncbi:cardiolipin synthase [Bacillus massiliigorillae]|uniref:cardiolipin synthase n=1 Tax=Bacillus massiliigorillae TaxID=1243664 RepID=UPI00039A25FF|nr:cardiolipin synthase [Bacillus massiliigorillae]
MKALLIILICILILIFLLLIDFKLGRKKHISQTQKTTYPKRNSDISLYTSGPELFEKLFQDIQQATQYVHILFFIVKNDKISQRFTNLLKKKVTEGVEVRLLLDWGGSLSFSKQTITSLKNAGVKFSFCHLPKFPFFFYSSQERNHRKITIIDGKIGYIGGFNIGKEYNNQDKKLNPWRDYHLRLKGEGVQDLEVEFLADWLEGSGENIKYKDIFIHEGYKGKHLHQFVPTEGLFLQETFVDLIKQAQNSIIIGTPYFIPSEKIMNELIYKLKKGVHIQILVPETSDHIFVKEASFPYFRTLLSYGAEIYQYQKGFFHAKYLLIDDSILDIGTANFDKRSLFLNHEINCLIYDSAYIAEVKQEIEMDFKNSSSMSLEQLNKFNIWRSTKEKIAAMIATFL